MAKPIHSMIRVLDEARSVDFYGRAFGMTPAERVEFPTFTLVYLAPRDGSFELELTVNHGASEAYDLGGGYGHLAFSVDDLEAEHRRMADADLHPEPIKELRQGAFSGRYFFLTDPDGYRIEVLQRGGRFQ